VPARMMNAAAGSPARQAIGLAVILLVFAGAAALLGSDRLKPPRAGRYAQAQGRWEAAQKLKWLLFAAGVVALLVALILSL